MNVKKHPGDIECAALTAALMIISKLNLDSTHEDKLTNALKDVVVNYMNEEGLSI